MCRTKQTVIILAVFVINTIGFASTEKITPQTEEKVRAVIKSLHTGYENKDVNGILELLHPGCEEPPKEFFKQMLLGEFKCDDPVEAEFDIQNISQYKENIAVQVFSKVKGMWLKKNDLYILKPHKGELLINGFYEQLEPNDFDIQTGVYTSKKGKFSLTIPAGWIPLKGVWLLRALTPDSVTILARDLESKVMMGLVQMPMKLDPNETIAAQKAVEADSAVEKREVTDYTVCEQGPASLGDMKGYTIITEFKAKDPNIATRKRMRAYFSDNPMLYFFICDAIGPEKFDTLLPQFEAVVTSFNMSPVDEKLSRQEAVAAEQAEGTVTGRVYSSKEFNCFIAAPEGWEIRTSPNPAHLVEMQYTKGKSIARLITAKGLRPTDKLNDIFTKRLEAVKGIVQDFFESSRQDVTIQEIPGIESIHTYYIEGFGHFNVKEVTLIREGTYYLILCQCIEPDDFTVLEKDFNKIIKSFGFIQ
ncbi:MAG: hypothetical protein JXB29_08530 [Sedimentisphaerales bacterium]|nr:hypothetical protein [Sedimentisphaerales bacterium]